MLSFLFTMNTIPLQIYVTSQEGSPCLVLDCSAKAVEQAKYNYIRISSLFNGHSLHCGD